MEDSYIIGTCQLMCPPKEARFRQKENILHKFEMKKGTEHQRIPEYDPNRIVKSFSRSAAGTETSNPSNLRPFPVLKKTINYLYQEIFPLHKDNPILVYDFMFDRFRAIRQDAVIQNLPVKDTINIFEPIVRFLIYFSYILAEKNGVNFDLFINNTHLQECLKKLLVCYDESESKCENQWEFESYYLLFNLGNIKPLTRGMKLCKLSKNKNYNLCLKLSFEWYLKNYYQVCQMIKQLPPLMLCIVNISIPDIRRYTLLAMAHAYSSVNSSYPVSKLRNLLLYESDSQVIEECKHFNIKVSQGNVNFLKKDFNSSAPSPNPSKILFVDNSLQKCDLVNLLCFGANKTIE